ncbi:MAG: chemotaxis protein CheW [Kofleriaceae bacterium]
MRIVVFEIGTCRLGVEGERVRELVRAVAVTAVPGLPAGVDGVIDVRGTIAPVFDLSTRLGLVPRAIRATDQLLICEAEPQGTVVLRADRIVELRDVPDLAAAVSSDPLVTGLARLPDGVIVVCDLAAFLSEADASVVAAAIASLGSP